MKKITCYVVAVGLYAFIAPVQLDAQAVPESRKLLNIIVQNADSHDGSGVCDDIWVGGTIV